MAAFTPHLLTAAVTEARRLLAQQFTAHVEDQLADWLLNILFGKNLVSISIVLFRVLHTCLFISISIYV